MDGGQVAVDAHTGEEQNRAVHVAIEDNCDGPAHDLSKYPVVPIEMVSYLKWQRRAKEKICDGQVDVEDTDEVVLKEEFRQGHSIGWHTNHKHHQVDGGHHLGTQGAAQVPHGSIIHMQIGNVSSRTLHFYTYVASCPGFSGRKGEVHRRIWAPSMRSLSR